MQLHVDNIKFSQNSIHCSFGHISFQQMCRDIIRGTETVDSLPKISVIKWNGDWYAMDGNRRLFVYKILHSKGRLGSGYIPVVEGFKGKDITAVEGKELEVRGNPTMKQDLEKFIDEL